MPCEIPPPAPPAVAQPTCARVSGSPGRSARSRPAPRTRGCGSAGTPPGWGHSGTVSAWLWGSSGPQPVPQHSRGTRCVSSITTRSQNGRSVCFLVCPLQRAWLRSQSQEWGTGRCEMILQMKGGKWQESAWKSSHRHQECVKPRKE